MSGVGYGQILLLFLISKFMWRFSQFQDVWEVERDQIIEEIVLRKIQLDHLKSKKEDLSSDIYEKWGGIPQYSLLPWFFPHQYLKKYIIYTKNEKTCLEKQGNNDSVGKHSLRLFARRLASEWGHMDRLLRASSTSQTHWNPSWKLWRKRAVSTPKRSPISVCDGLLYGRSLIHCMIYIIWMWR